VAAVVAVAVPRESPVEGVEVKEKPVVAGVVVVLGAGVVPRGNPVVAGAVLGAGVAVSENPGNFK
jgi:uncharacterized membrane protein